MFLLFCDVIDFQGKQGQDIRRQNQSLLTRQARHGGCETHEVLA